MGDALFLKFKFWRHCELVGSGGLGSVFCLLSAGRVGSLAGRVVLGQAKWSRGRLCSDFVTIAQ